MSRSRKRQRKSGQNWGRYLTVGFFIGLGTFVVTLVLGAFGFFAYAKNFIQSERFHRLVESKLSEALKADVELGEVSWEGSSAFASRVKADGYEDAAFARFGLAGLRARLDLSTENFKRGVWKVPEVTVSQLDVLFSESGRKVGKGPVSGAGETERGSREEGTQGKPSLISQLIPRELEMDELRFNNLNLFWETGDSKVSATGMQTVAQPTTAESSYWIRVRGGAIQGTSVPKLEIDRLDFRWRGKEIFVSEASLREESGALIELEGDIRLKDESTPGSMLVNAEVRELSLAELSKGRGQTRVNGDVEIVAKIQGDPGDLGNARQEGTFVVNNGVVETLPIMEMLASFTQSKRFERIALRDGGGAKFVRENGRTHLTEIDFRSDGLGRLTGELVIEDGNLDGLLQLGVIPGTLKWIPSAEQKIFTDSYEGHLWTDVRVGGTVDNPQHDLTPRLASAGVEAAVDMLGKLLNGAGSQKPDGNPSESEEGESPGDNAAAEGREAVGNAVDLGRELLKGFLR